MNRTEFLLQLAKEKKIAYVADIVTTINQESEDDDYPQENDKETLDDDCNFVITKEMLTNPSVFPPPDVEDVSELVLLESSALDDEKANEVQCAALKDHQLNTQKSCGKERGTICPICYNNVTTHFTRHLFRHHSENEHVLKISQMKPRSKDRLALVAALRKQGYFHMKTEKNIVNPVRASKNKNTEYVPCTYCLGLYTKHLLFKHIKICKSKPPEEMKGGKNCLAKSQTMMAGINSKNRLFFEKARLVKEVFDIMRPDEISMMAKNDPLICLYGEHLLNKHKRQQMSVVVSNKIREMARLLNVMKSINGELDGLFDVQKPEMFQLLIQATKIISGYDETTKSFKSPSLALHMGTNLKIICDVAFKIVMEKRQIFKIKWDNRETKKAEIKDLKKLIQGHWCNELSSLALKNLNERKWKTPIMLPLTSDIKLFQSFVNDLGSNAFDNLQHDRNICNNYKTLTECVLAQTVMFNRKRIGDVQHLKIVTYQMDFSTVNSEAFEQSLTEVEKMITKNFKRIVTDGKGSKSVPILFSKKTQKYIDLLLKIRESDSVVPKTNPYLFANPGSENRWMAGVNVIRKIAQTCGAQNPSLLTSSRFRKHIATTLQLMNMDSDEIEQIATFMGHTKKTHEEFYRLPQDIYQAAKVAKVLMLLEKGKGHEFREKNLNEIENLHNFCESPPGSRPSSPHEDEDTSKSNEEVNSTSSDCETFDTNPSTSAQNDQNDSIPAIQSTNNDKPSKIIGRSKWAVQEKTLVTTYFSTHIKKKITLKKHECEELIAANKGVLKKDWVRVKTFVYNTFRNKQRR